MSRPIDQSCDNCNNEYKNWCKEWQGEFPIDKGEMDEEDYSVRWCQYWNKRKKLKETTLIDLVENKNV